MANDNDEVKGPKTKPLRKTSSIPLRKETVRVTLKATPAGASGAPKPPAPAPPKPPSVATTPLETAPIDDAPVEAAGDSLPDVTSAVPLRQETMRVTLKADGGAPMAPAPSTPAPAAPATPAPAAEPAAPAPTIPLGGGAPSTPAPATPAPTVPLGGGSATVPLATQPLGGATGSSQPLPKATVQLQQTQQLTTPVGGPGGAPTMPTIQTMDGEDPTRGDGLLNALSIAAFVVALIALASTLMHADHWLKEYKEGDWQVLAEPEDVSFTQKKSATEFKTVK